jgi:hypothetical protein
MESILRLQLGSNELYADSGLVRSCVTWAPPIVALPMYSARQDALPLFMHLGTLSFTRELQNLCPVLACRRAPSKP